MNNERKLVTFFTRTEDGFERIDQEVERITMGS